ncbi:MAG: hypothetical protein PHC91_09355, partial [Eubacteriales bacterium]|nr:hypothetical protein [Eubacteriales bacterium]
TILTEDTKNAFLCIELIDESRSADLEEALTEMAGLVSKNLGGEVKIQVLDKDHNEMVIAE